jgi:hypothetical protein
MSDFVDSWQFRTALVGGFIAAVGVLLCFFGLASADGSLCALGEISAVAGNAAGVFGLAACATAFGWKWLQRRRARNR